MNDAPIAQEVSRTGKEAEVEQSVDSYQDIKEALHNQILYRLPLLKTLELCFDEQERSAVEQRIADMPEMANATRSASSLIDLLVNVGGVVQSVIADSQRMPYQEYLHSVEEPELHEYEQVNFFIKTSDAGRKIAAEYSTPNQLNNLYHKYPTLAGVFASVLEFCSTPRSFKEVTEHLKTLGYATMPNKEGRTVVQPAFVLEGLQETGSITWMEGWKRTEDEKTV